MKKLILLLAVVFSLCWYLNSTGYYGNFTGSTGANLPSDTVYMYVTVFDTLGLSRGSCKQDPEVWFKRWYGATYIDSTAGTQIVRGADSSLFYARALAKSGTRYGQYNVEIGWQICPTGTGKVFTKNESYVVMDTFPVSRAGYSLASGTQTFNMTGDITGNLSGSVASVTGKVTVADSTAGDISYIANTPNDYKATGFLTQALLESDTTYTHLRGVIDAVAKFLGATDGYYQKLFPLGSANKDSVGIFNSADTKLGTIYYFHTGSIIDSLRFEKW